MSEKRFDIIYDCQGVTRLIDRENKLISLDFGFDWNDLDNYEKDKVREWLDLLNEQQSTIDKLDQENADLLGARIKAQEEWEKCTDKLKEKIIEQQNTIDKQELRLQKLEELLELSENLNKSYREKLIDINLKMVIDDE